MRTFREIEKTVISNKKTRTIVLAGAHDNSSLEAIIKAKQKGLLKAILIGNSRIIRRLLKEHNERYEDYRIINSNNDDEIANLTFNLIKQKEADIAMKGLIMTSTFLKAAFNKEYGLVNKNALVSQVGICEHNEKLLFYTDCAINISPTVKDRIKMINNLKPLCNALKIKKPKVVPLSVIEKISPKIQSSIDAKEIAKHKFNDFVVEGPLALDGALSSDSIKHKNISSKIKGNADIVVMPNIEMGNVFYKSITYIANKDSASLALGAKVPIILTSRSDSTTSKYYSIITSLLL